MCSSLVFKKYKVFRVEENLPNLNFKRGFKDWFASSDKLSSVSFDVGKEGLRINSRGGCWNLKYKPSLSVKPGERYILTLEFRCSFKGGRFTFSGEDSYYGALEAKVLDEEMNTVNVEFERWEFGDPGEPFMHKNLGRWRSGTIAFSGVWDWRTAQSFFEIPERGKYLKLNIKGRGEGEVQIRSIDIEKAIFQRGILKEKRVSFKRLPAAVIYKRIPLGNYAGKLLRIGDLNGDGKPEFILAQNERIGPGDLYKRISCLTAINLEGEILWSKGDPDWENFEVTSDLPVGVFDINGDGKDEVVCCLDFEFLILDGEDGETIKKVTTPESRGETSFCEGSETLFARISGDCIAFCDLDGTGRPRDLLLKDRYNNIWAYNSELRELWTYSGKLIHMPLVWDFDDDGRDEVFVGDALIDHNGEVIWQIDLYDHCDSAVYYEKSREERILIIANQLGGFYWLDALTGNLLKEWHLGHAQVLSLGNFDPDVGYPLVCGQTYAGGLHQFLFDLEGKILHSSFNNVYGWVPVNWGGDGVELLASPYALYDCYGNIAVKLPEPSLGGRWGAKVYVWDVYGDPRDEIIVWNENYLTVYTQDEKVKGRIYRPYRRMYNQTWYGNFISIPGWSEV